VEERRDDQDPGTSGERRLLQQTTADESALPRTPEVLVQRTRITTGVYSVITTRPKRTA
jgi:hypothetical protein